MMHQQDSHPQHSAAAKIMHQLLGRLLACATNGPFYQSNAMLSVLAFLSSITMHSRCTRDINTLPKPLPCACAPKSCTVQPPTQLHAFAAATTAPCTLQAAAAQHYPGSGCKVKI